MLYIKDGYNTDLTNWFTEIVLAVANFAGWI